MQLPAKYRTLKPSAVHKRASAFVPTANACSRLCPRLPERVDTGRIKNLGEEINMTSILSYTAEGRLQTQKELLKNNVVFAGYNT